MSIGLYGDKRETWLDRFVSQFKTAQASINVTSLPSVNWKDETFYVKINDDGSGAVLYNNFGNEVSIIDNARSLDDVKNYLNDSDVVSTEASLDTDNKDNDFCNELKKQLDGMNKESDCDDEKCTEDEKCCDDGKCAEDEKCCDDKSCNDNVKEEVTAGEFDVSEQQNSEQPQQPQQEQQHQSEQQPQTNNQEDNKTACDDVQASVKPEQNEMYTLLMNKLDELTKKVADLSEAQHAYTEIPNDKYDLNCNDEEVKHFNESAQNAQKVIDMEHQLDLGKQSDRAKLDSNFLNSILSVTDDIDEDDVKDTDEDAIENAVEDNDEESDGEQEDSFIEVHSDDDDEEDDDDDESHESEEHETDSSDEDDIVVVQPDSETSDGSEDIVILDVPEDVEKFSNQICPFCDKESLNPVTDNGDYVGVICDNCGKEYAVNVNTSDIFYKK